MTHGEPHVRFKRLNPGTVEAVAHGWRFARHPHLDTRHRLPRHGALVSRPELQSGQPVLVGRAHVEVRHLPIIAHDKCSATLQATEMIQNIAQSLDYVGVLCVEFFLLPSGDACVNEIAPRPHNSGHLTIEAHATSQFQQQVRAVCGLPLGSTEQKRPAAMANLLGDCWQGQPPNWKSMLAHPNAALHLYGKAEARVGRKMGHITCLSETTAAAAEYVRRARASLDSHDDSTAAASHTADDAHHRESYIR